MTIKNRLTKLEEKHNPKGPPVIRVYFHDHEKGYSAFAHRRDENAQYYPTQAALFDALGWKDNPTARNIEVKYKGQGGEP